MEDRSYSTLSRHSLASSNSILDGVPFKIGQSFRPPPKVHPPELSRPLKSRNHNVEYTFETEEAVLAWAQAREAALEQAKKLEEQRKQALAAAEEQEGQTTSKSDNTVDCGTDENGCNVYDVPKTTVASMQNHDSDHNKPLLPPKPAVRKPISEPGSILKPTPIHSSANSVIRNKGTTSTDNKLADAASAFDVSMFESEADPFDNLELQTLNDMEELKILLDSSTKSSSDTVSTPAQEGHIQPSVETDNSSGHLGSSVSEAVYDIATVARENKWETFSDESQDQDVDSVAESSEPRGETSSPSVDCSTADRTSRQVIEDGEYVEITSNYKKQTIRFQNHSVSEVTKSSHSDNFTGENGVATTLGGKLPASLANSKLYKPVLPPFVRQANTVTDCNNVSTNPFIQTSAQGTNPFLPQTVQDTKYPFLQNTTEDGDTFTEASEQDYANGEMSHNQAEAASSVSTSKPSLLPPPPPSNRPTRNRHLVPNHRMWSSVGPSLAASLDESVSSSDHIPYNHYSRHSVSSSDLHSSNSCSDLGELNQQSPVLQKQMSSQPSLQSWNRHRPLPPIPTPKITASNPNLESYKVSHLPASQSVGLTDPYYSLSAEAQAFTNSLTSMGFLRARVARAVAKFGQDEKEVLDHLIAVDMLVEKKYAPVIVETALCTFKNDVEKAEKFLEMLTQFEELGFTRDKIQEALITTNMDHDKVLDILTT